MGSYSLTARCGVHSILLKAVSLSWHRLAAVPPSWPDILQRRSLLQGETALYRHIVFLCSIVVALLSTASAARADDSERCQELGRRLEITKSQITAIEVSLTLFSAVDGNCTGLAPGHSAMPQDSAISRWLISCWRAARRSMPRTLPAPPRYFLPSRATIPRSRSGLSNVAPT